MRREVVVSAAALVLAACFLACGLLLPSRVLDWQQQQLTGEAVAMQKAEVSPYQQTLSKERIKQLTEILLEGEEHMVVRQPLSGELSMAAAYDIGVSFLSELCPDAFGEKELDWSDFEGELYALSSDAQLSFWSLFFQGGIGEKEYYANLVLDGVSGLPLLIEVNTNWMDDALFFEDLVRQYEERFPLSFGKASSSEFGAEGADGNVSYSESDAAEENDVIDDNMFTAGTVYKVMGDDYGLCGDLHYLRTGDGWYATLRLTVSN